MPFFNVSMLGLTSLSISTPASTPRSSRFSVVSSHRNAVSSFSRSLKSESRRRCCSGSFASNCAQRDAARAYIPHVRMWKKEFVLVEEITYHLLPRLLSSFQSPQTTSPCIPRTLAVGCSYRDNPRIAKMPPNNVHDKSVV